MSTKRTPQGLTVAELIDLLQYLPQDKVVAFSYDYQDHWHSQVVKEIRNVEVLEVEYSDYHRMFKINDGEDPEDEEDMQETLNSDNSVVILM